MNRFKGGKRYSEYDLWASLVGAEHHEPDIAQMSCFQDLSSPEQDHPKTLADDASNL